MYLGTLKYWNDFYMLILLNFLLISQDCKNF